MAAGSAKSLTAVVKNRALAISSDHNHRIARLVLWFLDYRCSINALIVKLSQNRLAGWVFAKPPQVGTFKPLARKRHCDICCVATSAEVHILHLHLKAKR